MGFFPFKAGSGERNQRIAMLVVWTFPAISLLVAVLFAYLALVLMPAPYDGDYIFKHLPGLAAYFFVFGGEPASYYGRKTGEIEHFFREREISSVAQLRDFLNVALYGDSLRALRTLVPYCFAYLGLRRVIPDDLYLGWVLSGSAAAIGMFVGYLLPLATVVFQPEEEDQTTLERVAPPTDIAGVETQLSSERSSQRFGSEADIQMEDEAPYLPWGGVRFMAHELGGPHFAVTGTTGSGKTLTIRMLLQCALVAPGGGLRHRALVFDRKLDFYPILRGMGVPAEQIRILHPFDTRSVAWDIADDIDRRAHCIQFANLLVPDLPGEKESFWTGAPRAIIQELLYAFHSTVRSRWSLNDVFESLSDDHSLELVLSRTREGKAVLSKYLNNPARDTAGGITASLHHKWSPFQTVARLWARASDTFSIKDWMASGPSILLLPKDPTLDAALDPINQVLLNHVASLVLSQPGSYPTDIEQETWFVLDELPAFGRLATLDSILSETRSKGGRAVLGFQDIQSLYAVYDEALANHIVNQCSNFGVLRNSCPKTAAWASDLFGTYEAFFEQGFSESQQLDTPGRSVSRNRTLVEKQAILSSEFRTFPKASPRDGIKGAFLAGNHAWVDTARGPFVSQYLHDPTKDSPYDPRSGSDEEHIPWSAELAAELGKPPESGPSTSLRSLD